MKENSEEDIKNIEEIIELSKKEIDAKDENMTAILDIEDLISLKHILLDYKRVLEINEVLLKENEELKALDLSNSKMIANMSTRHFHDREKIRNSIPKQKIKDKLEELNKEIKSCAEIDAIFKIKQEQILQELLESEEKL